jgi:hypothetical protein
MQLREGRARMATDQTIYEDLGHVKLTVLLKNGRLEITGYVDRAGLGELIGMFAHYQAIMTIALTDGTRNETDGSRQREAFRFFGLA